MNHKLPDPDCPDCGGSGVIVVGDDEIDFIDSRGHLQTIYQPRLTPCHCTFTKSLTNETDSAKNVSTDEF